MSSNFIFAVFEFNYSVGKRLVVDYSNSSLVAWINNWIKFTNYQFPLPSPTQPAIFRTIGQVCVNTSTIDFR